MAVVCILLLATSSAAVSASTLSAFFAKLESGEAVNVVAIGGSITMFEGGWAERTVEHMRAAYPSAQINFVNAGISGTGSNFGVFRLERDVMSVRPDLVFIEFAVNDEGTADEACLRNLESMVVRLLSMPVPPAIVFINSAAEGGVKAYRHEQVAQQYGLLTVNMQSAVERHLDEKGLRWEDLFSDRVHPNNAGHAFYADTLWHAMQDAAISSDSRSPSGEHPIGDSPELMLNGALVLPNFSLSGWKYGDEPRQGWWGKYFQGSLQSGPAAEVLNWPFYGRTIGVVLMLSGGSGKLRLAVDGELIHEMDAYRPDWYYGIYVLPALLDEDWHVLSLIPLGGGKDGPKVRVAYLLAEDQATAPGIPQRFWSEAWGKRVLKESALTQLDWQRIPAETWWVLGPFGHVGDGAGPKALLNDEFGLASPPKVELEQTYQFGEETFSWQHGSGEEGWVNLKRMLGHKAPGVAFATMTVNAEKGGSYAFRVELDYYAYIYVNGALARQVTEHHGHTFKGIEMELPLQEGENLIVLKVHPGSLGFGFRMEMPKGKGLTLVD